MKCIVIFFDCHGLIIADCLKKFDAIKNEYYIKFIPLNDYHTQTKPVNELDKSTIYSADIAIIQHIKGDRPLIHHDTIKSYCKDSCRIVLLPHYVFSGYHPVPFLLPEEYGISKSDADLLEMYNEVRIDENYIIEKYEKSMIELSELDSDVEMMSVMRKYGKKYLMFNSRSYPTDTFFLFLSIKIMEILDIECGPVEIEKNLSGMKNTFATNVRVPILPCVGRVLGLEFDIMESFNCADLMISPIHYALLLKEEGYKFINLRTDGESYSRMKEMLMARSAA